MSDISPITSESNLTTAQPSVGADYRQAPGPNMSDTGSATISFDDFLDAINPLQHIPVVSSIYRAATGETINPIARIAGDTLYGGIFGLASAGLGALAAVGDEMFAGLNGGKSLSETVVAGLFGDDKTDSAQDVQLARNTAQPETQAAPTQTATMQIATAAQAGALQSAAMQSPILQTPETTAAQLAAAAAVESVPATEVAQNDSATPDPASAVKPDLTKAFPLDRNKLAYGGVMDNASLEKAQQNQALAMAMAGQSNILAAQRQLRNSRFAVANPDASKVSTTSVTAGNDLPAIKLDPSTENAMQNMLKELQAMKGTNQYKNTAQMSLAPGAGVDSIH